MLLLSALHRHPGPPRLWPPAGAQFSPADLLLPAPGVLGSGEAGRRPHRATPPDAQQRWGRRGLGLGWGRGGVIVLVGRPWDCYPAAGTGPPNPSPSRWRGKGSAGSGQLCAFLLHSSLTPSPPPTILATISGEAGLIFSGRPFLSLHLGGRGQRTLHLSLPLVGTPPRESALVSFPFPSRAGL